jgi:DegV family protein with EDD domain
MRLGLMVDATCDLPMGILKANNILIAPISLRIGDQTWVDKRDGAETDRFYNTVFAPGGGAADAESISTPSDVFYQEFMDKIVLNHEYAFVLTLSRARSPIFQNASDAASRIIKDAVMLRFKAGNKKAFGMRVINSQQLFAGQGVLTMELIDMINSGVDFTKIMVRMEELSDCTYTYGIPTDLKYIYERASKRGDRSVGFVGATLGGMLDIKPVVRCFHGDTGPVAKIRKWDAATAQTVAVLKRQHAAGQLLSKHVVASYGGTLAEAEGVAAVQDARDYCAKHGLTFTLSQMSASAAINIGPRTLSLAFISQPHEFA